MKTPESRAKIYAIIKKAEKADEGATRAEARAAVVQAQEKANSYPYGNVTSAWLIDYAKRLREDAMEYIADAARIIAE